MVGLESYAEILWRFREADVWTERAKHSGPQESPSFRVPVFSDSKMKNAHRFRRAIGEHGVGVLRERGQPGVELARCNCQEVPSWFEDNRKRLAETEESANIGHCGWLKDGNQDEAAPKTDENSGSAIKDCSSRGFQLLGGRFQQFPLSVAALVDFTAVLIDLGVVQRDVSSANPAGFCGLAQGEKHRLTTVARPKGAEQRQLAPLMAASILLSPL
jgi:hypothetical protein